jgi:2-keto-4-pentenoate hydratase/2-oxohepta-3-ene-1,7-dioic acid hydratase in catechol pathway
LKFALQKNFDGCCSIGPCIVVGEAVDPFDTWVETLINGERRQHFSTKDMVFTFGEYLEHLSRDFTFYAGDIISGGTPPLALRRIRARCSKTAPRRTKVSSIRATQSKSARRPSEACARGSSTSMKPKT